MTRGQELRRFSLAFAYAIGLAPIIFALLNFAFITYAYWRYPDPGSMTFFWAFFSALPPTGAASIAVFLIALEKFKPKVTNYGPSA